MAITARTPIPAREKLEQPLRRPQWAIRANDIYLPTDLTAAVQSAGRGAPGLRIVQQFQLWLDSQDRLQQELGTSAVDRTNPSPSVLDALMKAWHRGHAVGYAAGYTRAKTESHTVDLEAGE